AQSGSAPAVDPAKLGISIDRIRRELRESDTETRADSGLAINFRVEVFGQAPPIDIIGDFNVLSGPVPGSAPSHRDHIEHVTPQIYRAPVVPFSAIAVWAAKKLSEKSAKARCEEELARYRVEIMSGANIGPPSCAR
ncbi:MAG: hypothetical protein LC791_19870, partial [Acidobacteria bacterium]|nr:hypothetical protein [Acidobacteriota bacterium]